MKDYRIFDLGKVAVYLIVLILSVLFAVNTAAAHSPTSMEIQYDTGTETLTVTITHTVDNANDHYIERVEIRKNGELVTSKDYTSQPSESKFSYSYEVTASTGDSLEAEAICNRFGSISKSVDLSEDEPEQPQDGGVPWSVVAVILGVIIIVSAVIYKRR